MKKFDALELLRLVTFLPLVIVLLAMAGDDRYGTFQQADQFFSQGQPQLSKGNEARSG